MEHASTFEVALHAESFHEHCQGSQPSTPNTENGTGLWEEGLIYIQDHTVTDAAPKSTAEFKEKSLNKKLSSGWERGHSPAEPTGYTAYTFRFVSAYAKTHPQSVCGWMDVGDTGEG